MPKIKKRKAPKCSFCGKTGHNARTCQKKKESKLVEDTEDVKVVEPLVERVIKKTVSKPSVVVKVSEKAPKSPHVVNLKDDSRDEFWQEVEAYQEKDAGKEPERLTVDFAGMVRKANKNNFVKIEDNRLTEKVVKKEQHDLNENIFKIPDTEKPDKKFKFSIPKINITESVEKFKNNFNFKKFAYSAIIFLFILSLPFPAIGYYNKVKENSAKIVAGSTDAFLALQSSTVAAMNSDIDRAESDLNLALQSFDEVDSLIEREHQVLIYVTSLLPVVGKQVNSRTHLLSAGHHLALGNSYLVKGIDDASDDNSLLFTERLDILHNHLRSARPQYEAALEDLSNVDPKVLPVEYQQAFTEFKVLFATFIDDMKDLEELVSILKMMLGDEHLKRYLLVFQNHHELRPTGGFMGSFAILDIQKGRILNIDFPGGGTYDLQGQLDVYVDPPLPLQLTNGRWEFQDANWFPDFEASAKKMAWFYQHGRGVTVDGVIAVNASVLERFLSVVGSAKSEEFDITINQYDAIEKLQYEVEVDYDKQENKPKEVLGALLEDFLGSLGDVNSYDFIRLLSELYEAAEEKEIQIYLDNKQLQNKIDLFGWGGKLKATKKGQDYLMVVNTNIQGQKSDAKIEQTIEHQAVVQADGTVLNTVFIRRKHTGEPGEMFYGARNISYLRLYVPQGSELVDAGGFSYPPEEAFHVGEDWYEEDNDLKKLVKEVGIDSDTGTIVTEEFEKTAFGNWVMVSPGEETEVYFSYILPFNIFEKINPEIVNKGWKDLILGEGVDFSPYSLLVQKQSGTNSRLTSSVIYPEGWQPNWSLSQEIDLALNGATFETELKTDEVFGVIMERVKKNK